MIETEIAELMNCFRVFMSRNLRAMKRPRRRLSLRCGLSLSLFLLNVIGTIFPAFAQPSLHLLKAHLFLKLAHLAF